MARRRHLSKAPIREAVLDVRIETGEPADPSRLRGALESLDGFPEIHELTAGSLPLHFPGELQQENLTEAGSVIGVRGTTRERDWAIDFGRHGVTFRRSSPYPSWEEYSTRARPLESGLSAHVTHVLLDDLAPERIGFLLDIDVFSDNRFGPRTDQFWGTFERLRRFKNRLFFELITERTAKFHE